MIAGEFPFKVPGQVDKKSQRRRRSAGSKKSVGIRKRAQQEVDDEASIQTLDARRTRLEEEHVPPSVLAKMVVAVEEVTGMGKGSNIVAVTPSVERAAPDGQPTAPQGTTTLIGHPAANKMADRLDDICENQEVAYKFVLKQIAREVDRLDGLMENIDQDLDPSLVSSRRVIALKNFTNMYKELIEYRKQKAGGTETVNAALKLLMDCLREAAMGLLTDDQYNLLLDAVTGLLSNQLSESIS